MLRSTRCQWSKTEIENVLCWTCCSQTRKSWGRVQRGMAALVAMSVWSWNLNSEGSEKDKYYNHSRGLQDRRSWLVPRSTTEGSGWFRRGSGQLACWLALQWQTSSKRKNGPGHAGSQEDIAESNMDKQETPKWSQMQKGSTEKMEAGTGILWWM